MVQNILADAYKTTLDGIEKRRGTGSRSDLIHYSRQSTGMLVPDLLFGGGLVPGMTSISGMEASAKSTLTYHLLSNSVASGVPLVVQWDAEGSSDHNYMTSIWKQANLNYGDAKRLQKFRYEDDPIMETFFGYLSDLLKSMPEKVWIEEAKTWGYAFPKGSSKEAKKLKALMDAASLKPDKSIKDENNWIVPTEYKGIEALVVCDSWPSLLPKKMDEDEDPNNGMAAQARAFAENLKRVAGKFRSRGLAVQGVNQLREKPAVMYGSPTYEPCGNALRFFSINRNEIGARAVPQTGGFLRSKSKSDVNIEDSVYDPTKQDKYQFKFIRNTKNKTSQPFLSGWMRVWISDHLGRGRGFDPVFDCFEYLTQTGQVAGSKTKLFTINVGSTNIKNIDWFTFKALILYEVYHSKELKPKLKRFKEKIPKLREACFKQLRNGESTTLLANNQGKIQDDNED